MFTHKKRLNTSKKGSGTFSKLSLHFLFSFAILATLPVNSLCADSAKDKLNDSSLVEEFIKAKGYSNAIIFDSSNIKQFWIDHSVLSKDNSISICLKDRTSEPLNIQLANVLETQDCTIQVVTEDQNISFTILDKDSKSISESHQEDDFIQYHIFSSVIHLEDTQDFSFKIRFFSENNSLISIKKIILCFSDNKQSRYIGSHGFEQLTKEIENEGESVADSDVKLKINKENNKIFVRIPTELANSENMKMFFHIYPLDKKDLDPNRDKFGFNNMDSLLNSKKVIIPKPYANKSQERIIQIDFPKYPFSKIEFGQYNTENFESIWKYSYTNPDSAK